jgi:Recombinase
MLAMRFTARCRTVKKTERVRQVISGSLEAADLQQQTAKGWKLVAVEWEREVEVAQEQLPADVPFGLRVAPETQRLEEDPSERETLVQLMELLLQEGSYARIADEVNRRGLRTRQGARWTAVSVFEMLPRLIEVGPHVFQSAEWQRRRQTSPRAS